MDRRFCSSVDFKYELDCSCFRRDVQDSYLRYLVGTRDRCLLGEPNCRRPFRPGHAPPRPDPLVVCPGFGLGRFCFKFPDMPCMKRVYRDKRCRSTGQQPGTKNAFRPAIKPLVNRGSTAHFVPPIVYIGFRLFVLLERRSGDVSAISWRERWSFVSWANSSVGTQSCPTPPGRSAGRPDPSCPWYVRVLDSTGGIVYVRAAERTSRAVVLVVLEVEVKDHSLAEWFRAAFLRSRPAQPALPRLASPLSASTGFATPGPAQPHCALPRPVSPVGCAGFGFDWFGFV